MSIKYPTLNFDIHFPLSVCIVDALLHNKKWKSEKITQKKEEKCLLIIEFSSWTRISARNSEEKIVKWKLNRKIAIEVSKNILFRPSRIRLLTRGVLRCNVCVVVSQFGQFDLPSHTLVIIIIIIIIRHRQRWIHVQ